MCGCPSVSTSCLCLKQAIIVSFTPVFIFAFPRQDSHTRLYPRFVGIKPTMQSFFASWIIAQANQDHRYFPSMAFNPMSLQGETTVSFVRICLFTAADRALPIGAVSHRQPPCRQTPCAPVCCGNAFAFSARSAPLGRGRG